MEATTTDEDDARTRAEAIQNRLAPRVVTPHRPTDGYTPSAGDLVLSLDIQYVGDQAHVAGDLQRWGGDYVCTFAGVSPATFPYIPGYFCFREGPPLYALIRRLIDVERVRQPDVVVVDGHGLAHPRKFGVACWLGLATGLPTIGCAKSTLVRFPHAPDAPRGSVSPVLVKDDLVGYVLRNQDGVRPIYVSAGHRVHLDAAVDTVLGLPGEYKLPDPFRRADQAARLHSKGASLTKGWRDLGVLEPVEPPFAQIR